MHSFYFKASLWPFRLSLTTAVAMMVYVFNAYDHHGYWPIWQILLCIGILHSFFQDQDKFNQACPSFWLSQTGEMQYHLQQDLYQVIQVKWISSYFCFFVIKENEGEKTHKIWVWHDTLTLYAYKSLCRSLQQIKHKVKP